MNFSFLGVFLIVTSFATTIANAQEEPFAFRGFKLGMTSDEFRRVPHPDKAQSWLAKKPLKVFCTGDPLSKGSSEPLGLGVSSERRKAGIARCGYMSAGDFFSSYSVTIGGYGESVFEFFRPTEKEPYRLYSIAILLPEKMFKEVSEAYIDKFGKPTADAIGEVQNNFGAKFENRTLAWNNSSGSILIEQRSSSVTTTAVIYMHSELSNAAADSAKTAKGLRNQL